jgi:rod shape-determining protein MreC
MYDKQVRRRRLVLVLLVGLSLLLLTAYFGESSSSPLHSVQRGVLNVVSPIQEGANRALKPFRDLFGWAGDTLDAKDERDELKKEVRELRAAAIRNEAAARENTQLRAMVEFEEANGIDRYRPVTTRVIGRSPTVWYSTITIDKGRSAGVRPDQPVVNGDGLVGKVTAVATGTSIVTLITDHTSGVSARVNGTGAIGTVQPEVGNPNDLLLDFVAGKGRTKLVKNSRVVTAGTRSGRLESLFPPDIPIGTVTKVDEEELALYQRVHIKPYADLRNLEFVQILTRPDAGGGTDATNTAQVP